MFSRFAGCFLVILFALSPVRAQERDSSTTLSVAAASLVPAALVTSVIELNYQAFWKHSTAVPFYVSPDPPYSMHIDKFSHMYLSMVGSDAIRAAYHAAGVPGATSAWLGAGLSLVTGALIELEDARHGDDPQYGLSPGDLGADLLGAALPVIRHYWPAANRLTMKLSLWPSDAYKAGAYHTIADDYESQYYWFSYDMHDLTGTPPWLNVALGFGCENLSSVAWIPSRAGTTPRTDIYLSPDLNLKGLPIHGAVWDALTDVLSYVRIPLPALQVFPRVKFWGLR